MASCMGAANVDVDLLVRLLQVFGWVIVVWVEFLLNTGIINQVVDVGMFRYKLLDEVGDRGDVARV